MAAERLRLIDIIANKLTAKVTLSGSEEWHARDGASSKKIRPDAVALYVLNMAGLVGAQLFEAANAQEAQQAMGVEPGVDVQPYATWLASLVSLLTASVTTSTDENGDPITVVHPGYVQLRPDGTLGLGDIDTSGMATQTWTLGQIAAAVGSIAFPDPTPREALEEQFLQWIEYGRSPMYVPTTNAPKQNGQLAFELTSNTQLTLRVKGSDGTTRSVALTLA